VRIYSFEPAVGWSIERFESRGVTFSPILRDAEQVRLAAMHLEPNGLIGRHEATVEQLFLVVGGGGVVSGADAAPAEVGPGSAIFWQRGEMHETRAGQGGLLAIVCEGDDLESKLAAPLVT
jgi:quercetin dioxygenase-like cupin family protein